MRVVLLYLLRYYFLVNSSVRSFLVAKRRRERERGRQRERETEKREEVGERQLVGWFVETAVVE